MKYFESYIPNMIGIQFCFNDAVSCEFVRQSGGDLKPAGWFDITGTLTGSAAAV